MSRDERRTYRIVEYGRSNVVTFRGENAAVVSLDPRVGDNALAGLREALATTRGDRPATAR